MCILKQNTPEPLRYQGKCHLGEILAVCQPACSVIPNLPVHTKYGGRWFQTVDQDTFILEPTPALCPEGLCLLETLPASYHIWSRSLDRSHLFMKPGNKGHRYLFKFPSC